jgi:hypothetical protein
MLTPEEMRAKSAEAAKEAQKQARAEKRRLAKEKRQRIAAYMECKDAFIQKVEYAMEKAGLATQVRVKVNTSESWSKRDEWKPVLQAVVDHFVAQGFKASYQIDGQTEWFRGEAGPGDDWHYITVDWSPDA